MEMTTDAALQHIAKLTGGSIGSASGSNLTERVASALGWEAGAARIERERIFADGLTLANGFIGPQKALLFVADGRDATTEKLSEAARYAYHSSTRWGVVA